MKRDIILFLLSALLVSSCATVRDYATYGYYQDGIYSSASRSNVRIYTEEEFAQMARQAGPVSAPVPNDTVSYNRVYGSFSWYIPMSYSLYWTSPWYWHSSPWYWYDSPWYWHSSPWYWYDSPWYWYDSPWYWHSSPWYWYPHYHYGSYHPSGLKWTSPTGVYSSGRTGSAAGYSRSGAATFHGVSSPVRSRTATPALRATASSGSVRTAVPSAVRTSGATGVPTGVHTSGSVRTANPSGTRTSSSGYTRSSGSSGSTSTSSSSYTRSSGSSGSFGGGYSSGGHSGYSGGHSSGRVSR